MTATYGFSYSYSFSPPVVPGVPVSATLAIQEGFIRDGQSGQWYYFESTGIGLGAGKLPIDFSLEAFVFKEGTSKGPHVQPPQRKGFGTKVITSMAKMSVDGAVEITYAATGVVWRLTCPAVNAIEESAGGNCERIMFVDTLI